MLSCLVSVLGRASLFADDGAPAPREAAPLAVERPEPPAPSTTSTSPSNVPAIEVAYHQLASEEDARALCESFLQRIVGHDYGAAFDLVRPYFPISAERFFKLKHETEKQHGLAELQFGAPLGYVLVRDERIEHAMVNYVFLEKYAWDAMYWELVFYNPKDGWIVNRLGFGDELNTLFK